LVGTQPQLVAISPHLDDAVLGCAELLITHPNAYVVTVAAGKPPAGRLTEWDRACGFGAGDDVVGRRRAEDRAALERLGARPVWLEFLDRQYGRPPTCIDVAHAVDRAIAAAHAALIAFPLGIGHADHVLTARACLRVARRIPQVRWTVFEDAIYRTDGNAVGHAIRRVHLSGFDLQPATSAHGPGLERKHSAIQCYRSQLKGLGDRWRDGLRQERYWRLKER
jgi:LmbE family N-acetylglucosaminyl deacetylase